MKWMVIKGVRYPSSVISAFAAYNMDNPFLKVRIRNREMVDIQEGGNVLGSQGAGRGRIGLGHILYPVLWIGGRDAN